MFTGIVQRKGVLREIRKRKENTISFGISCDKWDTPLTIGESIAVDGVCLTVKEIKDEIFFCDLLQETLQKTTLGSAKVGQSFNLERALKPLDFMGGHIVTGHIDGTGVIINKLLVGEDIALTIEIHEDLFCYVVQKGSIAIDGISLTTVSVERNSFSVHLIPHTYTATTLGEKTVGMLVNIEVDILAKYVEKILSSRIQKKAITIEDLKRAGF